VKEERVLAITRRQFVTRLGALAAAAGFSQGDVSRIVEAMAYGTTAGKTNLGGTLGKPRVIWIHGAECTGCSTSLLGIFEDVTKGAFPKQASPTIADAATLAGVFPTELAGNAFTYHALNDNPDYATSMNIADVVVDVIDLQYHETVMNMGGDLAAQWLHSFLGAGSGATTPFVLVVEGAIQPKDQGGAWGDTAGLSGNVPWCSVGMSDNYVAPTTAGGAPVSGFELDVPEIVHALALKSNCYGIIPIGQCATFGGYPGCKPQVTTAVAGFDVTKSQTGAKGVYDFLYDYGVGTPERAASAKVINVPGCPTNPWWFVLTVTCFLVDLVQGVLTSTDGPLGVLLANGSINPAAVDNTRRLKKVYGNPIHGAYCPRYQSYTNGVFAAKPGDPGCLPKIGCKGPASNSLCGLHGWNNQQPQNPTAWDYGVSGVNGVKGGHCTTAGHPCMACTEKGYPDSFVPFVVLK